MRLVRKIYRTLRHPRVRRNRRLAKLTERLFERDLWKPCRHTVAGGLSLGLIFAMTHVPLQSLFAAFFAMRFRVNVAFAVAVTWVTNPLTTPGILILQNMLGSFVRGMIGFGYPALLSSAEMHIWGKTINFGEGFLDTALGALLSGVILGALAYPAVHLVGRFIPHHHLPHSRVAGEAISLSQKRVLARQELRKAALTDPPQP
jgi:uncharacterized protein (DUF2062 family)